MEDGDAVNKKYVDGIVEDLTLKQGLIRENGGFNLVDSYINMNFNNIRNVGNPIHGADAVPRLFVDNIVKELEEKIKRKKHLIAASASYHGDLISGRYQFTWGGQSKETYRKHDLFNGFLIPSSGYLQSLVILDTGLKLNIPKNKDILDYMNDVGYYTHIPLFTLVLIKRLEEPIEIGTYFYYFKNEKIEVEYIFKLNPNFTNLDLIAVKAKDIINIRSEFSTIKVADNKLHSLENSNYEVVHEAEFYTYLVTVLI